MSLLAKIHSLLGLGYHDHNILLTILSRLDLTNTFLSWTSYKHNTSCKNKICRHLPATYTSTSSKLEHLSNKELIFRNPRNFVWGNLQSTASFRCNNLPISYIVSVIAGVGVSVKILPPFFHFNRVGTRKLNNLLSIVQRSNCISQD